MDLRAQRDLQLLSEVEKDCRITQRTLAKKLGVALGLTNLYLKRLAPKGVYQDHHHPPEPHQVPSDPPWSH